MTINNNTEDIHAGSIPQTPSFLKYGPGLPGALGRIVETWSPHVTGDWSIDCARGRTYADEALDFMRQSNNPTYLGHVVKGMIGNGAYSGVEVGFMQRIGELIIKSGTTDD